MFDEIEFTIPPAAVVFAEIVELRRQIDDGSLTEGVDYDVVTVDEQCARECFKPGSLSEDAQ